jgi:hypothetical protein
MGRSTAAAAGAQGAQRTRAPRKRASLFAGSSADGAAGDDVPEAARGSSGLAAALRLGQHDGSASSSMDGQLGGAGSVMAVDLLDHQDSDKVPVMD